MKRRKRPAKRLEPLRMTVERATKPDVVRGPGGKPQVKSYGERLRARAVINERQLQAWLRIEALAEQALYRGRPKGSRLDSPGGGIEQDETEKYIRARQRLARLFEVLGLMGTSVIEFMVIMGEDADTFARRMPGWNRHKILGALCLALDVAASELGLETAGRGRSGQRIAARIDG